MVLALAVSFIAGGVQRITGMGFALCATPVLVVLYGPTEGVRLVVLLGIVASVALLFGAVKQVEWRRAWRLIWPGLAVSPVGGMVAFLLPEPALLLVVASAATLSLMTNHVPWLGRVMAGEKATMKAGAMAGFLNITSGLSGPSLAAYASSQKWNHTSFVASVQVVFIMFDTITLVWRGPPETSLADCLALLLSVSAGVLVTSLLSRYIKQRLARRAMFAVAWIGVVAVLIRGIVAMTGN